MKQRIIELKKKLLLVELPEGFKWPRIDKEGNTLSYINDAQYPFIKKEINIFCFDMKLIDKLTDMAESQFEGLVGDPFVEPSFRPLGNTLTYPPEKIWCDYTHGGVWRTNICGAKESFFSKLEVDGIAFENKVVKPNENDFKLKGRNEQEFRMIEEDRIGKKPTWASIFKRNYRDELNKWQEAQEKVFDINRCWLFEIL